MSPLNGALIAGGPLVAIGVPWLLAKLGDRLAERDAEQMRQLGRMHVEAAERQKEPTR